MDSAPSASCRVPQLHVDTLSAKNARRAFWAGPKVIYILLPSTVYIQLYTYDALRSLALKFGLKLVTN